MLSGGPAPPAGAACHAGAASRPPLGSETRRPAGSARGARRSSRSAPAKRAVEMSDRSSRGAPSRIHSAIASPSAGETLRPPDAAAAHHPRAGHAGERSHEVAVVHRQGGQPPAVLGHADRGVLEDRELLAHRAREPPQDLDVEGQLGDVERGRQRGRIELHGIGLVPAEHEPAALVADVDVGVDHAGDREVGPDPGDRLRDQELMAGRHHGQRPRRGRWRRVAPTRPRRPRPPAWRWCRPASARPPRRAARSRSPWPACAGAGPPRASRPPGSSRWATRTARRCSPSGSTSRRRCRARRGWAADAAPRRPRQSRARPRRRRRAPPRGRAARRRARCARSSGRHSA